MSSVETGQMSAVETGQMSAAETGQMSAVETRQMPSVARTDICFVSTHNVEVSEVSTVPLLKSQNSQLSQCPQHHTVPTPQCSSPRHVNCHNTTMFKSQTSQLWQCHNVQVSDRRPGPKSAKMARNGSRMVARPREST